MQESDEETMGELRDELAYLSGQLELVEALDPDKGGGGFRERVAFLKEENRSNCAKITELRRLLNMAEVHVFRQTNARHEQDRREAKLLLPEIKRALKSIKPDMQIGKAAIAADGSPVLVLRDADRFGG